MERRSKAQFLESTLILSQSNSEPSKGRLETLFLVVNVLLKSLSKSIIEKLTYHIIKNMRERERERVGEKLRQRYRQTTIEGGIEALRKAESAVICCCNKGHLL